MGTSSKKDPRTGVPLAASRQDLYVILDGNALKFERDSRLQHVDHEIHPVRRHAEFCKRLTYVRPIQTRERVAEVNKQHCGIRIRQVGMQMFVGFVHIMHPLPAGEKSLLIGTDESSRLRRQHTKASMADDAHD